MEDNHPTVPCGICGTPTPMTGTKRCDWCYELEGRIQRHPDRARQIIETLPAKHVENDEVWHTKDGRTLTVASMEPEHVRAVLRQALRKLRKRRELAAQLDKLTRQIDDEIHEDRKWGDS